MGKHFVPRHYLRGFITNGPNEAVWQFDKQNGKFGPIPYPISDVAQKPKFYDESTEEKLTLEVERPGQAVINQLRDRNFHLTEEARQSLSVYMATMITRVPAYRAGAAARVSKTFDQVVNRISAEVLQWHDKKLISDEKREALLSGINAFVEKHSDNPAIVVRDQINDPYPFLSWVLALMAMTWRFVLSEKTQVVTCDNPLFFFKGRGLGKPNSEITFPIDSHLVLFGSYQPLVGSPVVRNARWHEKEANRRIISNAGRFVFAKRAEDWIEAVAAKRQPHLSEIRWISFETVEQPAF